MDSGHGQNESATVVVLEAEGGVGEKREIVEQEIVKGAHPEPESQEGKPEEELESMIDISGLNGMSWKDAESLIGVNTKQGKVIGVDNCPPKFRAHGVYLVLGVPGSVAQYKRVG